MRTAEMFRQGGIAARAADLWPEWISKPLNSGKIPFGRRIFSKVVAPCAVRKSFNAIEPNDVVWILGPAVLMQTDPREERRLKSLGAKFVFHVMDDWFEVPILREGTLRRAAMADLIVVPTPELLERVFHEVPDARAVRLEEPIDIERVFPTREQAAGGEKPVLVWTGNPNNFRFIELLKAVFEILSKEHQFRLRIISGKKPVMDFPFDWEWIRYDYESESSLLDGAVAGLSPLEDTTYNRSKGSFKVKTYMSAGLPVVGSGVGYQTELIEPGKTGFLCSSPTEWASALSTILSNRETARQMGNAARSVAEQRFSHAAVSHAWLAAIRPLLHNGRNIPDSIH